VCIQTLNKLLWAYLNYTTSFYYKQGKIWVHKNGLETWYFSSLTKPWDLLIESLGTVSLHKCFKLSTQRIQFVKNWIKTNGIKYFYWVGNKRLTYIFSLESFKLGVFKVWGGLKWSRAENLLGKVSDSIINIELIIDRMEALLQEVDFLLYKTISHCCHLDSDGPGSKFWVRSDIFSLGLGLENFP